MGFSIRLVVVSLPINQEDECEDIGYAFIDINDVLDANQDFNNQELNCDFNNLKNFLN